MSEQTTEDTSKATETLGRIVETVREVDVSATAKHARIGKLCATYITQRWRERRDTDTDYAKVRSDSVQEIKARLRDSGVRTLDVSAYLKYHALATLCADSVKLPKSIAQAIFPAVRFNGRSGAPEWAAGYQAPVVTLIGRALAESLSEATVREEMETVRLSLIDPAKASKRTQNAALKAADVARQKLADVLAAADDTMLSVVLRAYPDLAARLALIPAIRAAI